MVKSNEFNQPVGNLVIGWDGARAPQRKILDGSWCYLEIVDVERHAESLYQSYAENADASSWTYLPYGPFDSLDDYRSWLATEACNSDPLFYAIIDKRNGRAVGLASYLRIKPASGSIEVGHIHFADSIKRSLIATEVMYLMMRQVFDWGYRRYEWKCDALNEPSRRAALRLGFQFEGIFRQALVYKGRNRDTAWYSVIDHEWPRLERAFEQWLAPQNFDADGKQRSGLQQIRDLLQD
jgi:RimJ/RimL family protein N-acetyltransferase